MPRLIGKKIVNEFVLTRPLIGFRWEQVEDVLFWNILTTFLDHAPLEQHFRAAIDRADIR